MNLFPVDWDVLRVSFLVAGTATVLCVLIGTPLAWAIARTRRVIVHLLTAAALLPLVLPPTAVGYYLLQLLGRQSPVGRFLEAELGLRLVFTWPGMAIAAAVVALPLFVRTAVAGFEQLEPAALEAASVLVGPVRRFFSVALPLAWPSVTAASLLAFARALGEFGATTIVGANIPGRTEMLSGAIYTAVLAGDDALANSLAGLSLVLGLTVLVALSLLLAQVRRNAP
ncbi:MAG: ABC transporter permease subunit [Chloroflexota bacterium]|nr:ABC transporter permease subunit [Dehalococcoidia bacterium]MDW8047735.1 ABC transporter permease subunit [Chloroflexota bacterium]